MTDFVESALESIAESMKDRNVLLRELLELQKESNATQEQVLKSMIDGVKTSHQKMSDDFEKATQKLMEGMDCEKTD